MIAPRRGSPGRPPTVKNREALEGVLHVPRTGTPWRDLPNAYGPWHTISMRWQRWIERALWGEILKLLQRLKGVDLTLVFLDSPVVRAHQHAAMDKAYDSNAIRAKPDAKGITPVIPPRSNRLEIIVYDPERYQQRNKVERLFNQLKQFRRVATRYEKLKAHFLAFVTVALIVIMLR